MNTEPQAADPFIDPEGAAVEIVQAFEILQDFIKNERETRGDEDHMYEVSVDKAEKALELVQDLVEGLQMLPTIFAPKFAADARRINELIASNAEMHGKMQAAIFQLDSYKQIVGKTDTMCVVISDDDGRELPLIGSPEAVKVIMDRANLRHGEAEAQDSV